MKYTFEPTGANAQTNHLGSYRRRLPVSLERMYENALDWAHLPHVHASTFDTITCTESGAWGWRATVTSGDEDTEIELLLDRQARRWITRTKSGQNVGAEIWTQVFQVESRVLDITVDFFVPDIPASDRLSLGKAYAAVYERLYDEDVALMSERQRQLDRRLEGRSTDQSLSIENPSRLPLPHAFSLGGRDYLLHQQDQAWLIYPARCPHQLGPLDALPLVDGQVTCPWHGYVFDVRSGRCVSGATCHLGPMPTVTEHSDGLVVSWALPVNPW